MQRNRDATALPNRKRATRKHPCREASLVDESLLTKGTPHVFSHQLRTRRSVCCTCNKLITHRRVFPNVILRTLFRFKQSDICTLLAKFRRCHAHSPPPFRPWLPCCYLAKSRPQPGGLPVTSSPPDSALTCTYPVSALSDVHLPGKSTVWRSGVIWAAVQQRASLVVPVRVGPRLHSADDRRPLSVCRPTAVRQMSPIRPVRAQHTARKLLRRRLSVQVVGWARAHD